MIPRIAALLAAGALALGLGACAAPGPTPYAAAGPDRFGHDVKALEDGNFRVAFTANRLTPRGRVEDSALYRAAELALANGMSRFAVMDRTYDTHVQQTYAFNIHPPGFDSFESRFRGGSAYSDQFESSRLVRTESRTAVLIVRPFRDAPPAGAQRTYEAKAVIDRLSAEIGKPGKSPP